MGMNKRGISPLMATVFIIGFTVALATIIMVFGEDYITGTQELTPKQEILQEQSFILLDLYDSVKGEHINDSGFVYFENKGIDYRWYFDEGHWASDWSLPECPYNETTDTIQCGIMTILIGDEWDDFRGIVCRYDLNNIDSSYERVEIDLITCEYVYNDLGDSYSLIEETDQIKDIPISPSFNHIESENECEEDMSRIGMTDERFDCLQGIAKPYCLDRYRGWENGNLNMPSLTYTVCGVNIAEYSGFDTFYCYKWEERTRTKRGGMVTSDDYYFTDEEMKKCR